ERPGEILPRKGFTKGLSYMGWKVSITSAHAKNCGYLTNSKSKQWPQSANRDRKNRCLKSCRRAKARTIAGSFLRASSKGLSNLNKDHGTDQRRRSEDYRS